MCIKLPYYVYTISRKICSLEPGRGEIMHCPLCNGIDTGKVGTNQFYCWQCLLEFRVDREGVRCFYVEADGSLVSVNEGKTVESPSTACKQEAPTP
jgi:hypothetical protein